jgi:hypothetical protein
VLHHTMQWIWANSKQNFPHWPPKIILILYVNIILVATQRTRLSTSEIIGLGMLLVVLPNEANVPCYLDLGLTKLYSQWLGYSLTPVSHITSTSTPTTTRFGNSQNIPNFFRKHVKGSTLEYYARWEMYNTWPGTPLLLAIWWKQYIENIFIFFLL